MGFKCMGFKANFNLPGKEKPPQVVCLKYISHSEFDNLSKPLPSTTNNISIKPIKSKPVAPKPEILSIFNFPSTPLTEFEPKQEAVQHLEPPKSILKETKSNEDGQVEASSSNKTQEPDNLKSLLTYSTENEFETNDNQAELPPSEKDVTLLFANEQEISTIFSTEEELENVLASFPTEQAEVLASFPAEQETPSSFSTEQQEVPPSFSTEQEEVPPISSSQQEEVPTISSTEQEEVPPISSTEQEEVSPSNTNEQVEVLNKEKEEEEEEEIITSEDDTPHNSPYQVRYAKKPVPSYEPKLNDESEISDYESEDDDLDLTDANNNQDGYSSQAASIFFAGVEAEPTPRLIKLPKEDDEV